MSMSVQQLSYWYVKFALKWLKTWNGWLTPDKAEKKKKITQGSYEYKKSVGYLVCYNEMTSGSYYVPPLCGIAANEQCPRTYQPSWKIPSQNSVLCTLMSII